MIRCIPARCVLTGFVLLLASPGAWTQDAPAVDSAAMTAPRTGDPPPVVRTAALPELFGPENAVTTSALDVRGLRAEDEALDYLGPLRMGVVQDVPENPGLWTEFDDGSLVWTLQIQAGGAAAIRLHLDAWQPAASGELVMYDAHDPAAAFRLSGEVGRAATGAQWTYTLYTDTVNLEYYVPPGKNSAQSEPPRVLSLLNQYRMPGVVLDRELSCHLDVACYPAWYNAEGRAVGALSVIQAQYGFFCSGCLLNRIPSDWTPFFATARHCGVDETNDDSLLVTWFWQTPSCNGTPPAIQTCPQTRGVLALVNDANTDYTLVGLDDRNLTPQYAGWDANYWANGSAATCVHHPDGSWKRITFGTKNWDVTSCIPGQAWQMLIPDGDGEIEPGSSGAPVFDAAHRVRGTNSCANWNCTTDNAFQTGRLDVAYPLMQPYIYTSGPTYVNKAFGGTEKGTVAEPFRLFGKGMFAVPANDHLWVESGSYNERYTIRKPMTIHARNGAATIGQ